jgi:hypothetical protein
MCFAKQSSVINSVYSAEQLFSCNTTSVVTSIAQEDKKTSCSVEAFVVFSHSYKTKASMALLGMSWAKWCSSCNVELKYSKLSTITCIKTCVF